MIRPVRNGLWSVLSTGISAFIGLASSILIVRSLTPIEYGEFSYYLWLAGVLIMLGTLSLPVTTTKIISELCGNQQQEEAKLLSIWVILGVLLLNSLMGLGLLVIALNSPIPKSLYLIEITIVLVANGLAAILRSTMMGQQNYKPVSIIVIVSAFIQLGIIFFVYVRGGGIFGFLSATYSTYALQAILLIIVFWKPKIFIFRSIILKLPQNDTLKRFIGFAIPAALFAIFETVIWQRSEIFFLRRLSTFEQVGFYNLAFTAFSTFLLLGWAVVNGFYPAISNDFGAKAWDRIQGKVKQGLILATVFAVPISFGGFLIIPRLVPIFYGQKMMPSVPVAQILFLGMLPGAIAGMLNLTVSAIGGIWIHVYLGMLVSILNILADLLLIPHYGATGAAIANTSSQILYVLMLIIVMNFKYKIMLPWKLFRDVSGIGIITTLVAPAAILGLIPGALGLLITIGVAGIAYFLAIWSLGYLQFFRKTIYSI